MPARARSTAPPLSPPDPPMVPFAVGGLIVWALAGLAFLAFRDALVAHGHRDWPQICLAGFLVGLPGLAVMIKHDAGRRRQHAESRGAAPESGPEPGPEPEAEPAHEAEEPPPA